MRVAELMRSEAPSNAGFERETPTTGASLPTSSRSTSSSVR